MKCSTCGHENQGTARFRGACTAPLAAPACSSRARGAADGPDARSIAPRVAAM